MLSYEIMRSYYMTIEEEFGIRENDLHWTEKIALSSYIESFKKTKKDLVPADQLDSFMRDYFGLSRNQLIKQKFPRNIVWDYLRVVNKKINFVPQFSEYLGSNFAGTEEFKEYCRRNLDLWREERNLL